MNPPTLAERIREEREWIGATREQLGDELGVSPAVVETWEAGELVPSEVDMMRLARFFRLSVARLHGEPLREDPKLAVLCGGADLTHGDRYEVARFGEYLRNKAQEGTP